MRPLVVGWAPFQFLEIAKSQLHQLIRIIVRPEENLIMEFASAQILHLLKMIHPTRAMKL